MKYALLLLFLVACAPALDEVLTQPAPKDIPQESAIAPAEPVEELESVVVPQPVKAKEPVEVVEQDCTSLCETSCAQSAQNACTQNERSACRANCNDIIDPSACTQACAYLSQEYVCKKQMNDFCSNQCVVYCN